jgi:Zn-dependent protease
MKLEYVEIVFQIIAFLFAISVHESAHAWMANLRGDPTARMLGRITLNPVKHIDPIGTILLPAIAAFSHIPMIGWAKPTPVNPKNFSNPVLDDILTSVVGPVSNFVVAGSATAVLLLFKAVSPVGKQTIEMLVGHGLISDSLLFPVCLLFYELLVINVLLGVFNLIPIPPLDGSHVLRHLLPGSMQRAYDMFGIFGLILLMVAGGGIVGQMVAPFLRFFRLVLLRG